MRIATVFMVTIAVVLGALAQSQSESGTDIGIPDFEYIRELDKFSSENSEELTPDQRRALKFAKGIVALRQETEVEGRFSVAEADWGYQVNFSGLKTKKNGVWTEVVEGFGEVFISKALDRIVINCGP